MSAARFIVGDTRDVTASLPDGSVDLVLTSPPFLALRSYLPADHPDKHREIGSEATPDEFLQVLLELAAEWRRVLAPHGSIAVELGDTYSGSGGAGGDYAEGGMREGQERFDGSASRAFGTGAAPRPPRSGRSRDWPKNAANPNTKGARVGWPLDKSLCGIPHLFHLSLAYGRNLLTGEESPAGQWRVRNVVAWCRPNPPVGALGDKFRPATSYMTIATPSRTRYFDLDAVRTAPQSGEAGVNLGAGPGKTNGAWRGVTDGGGRERILSSHPAGAPPLDWWEIPTQPYKGSHYATWPEALCDKPILSMVPPKVCLTCGEPSRRITKPTDEYEAQRCKGDFLGKSNDRANGLQGARLNGRPNAEYETTGWSDCGHGDNYRRGIVLDPFAGSGTTLKVAVHHGRDAIGIDLDARNADLARERVGMFLSVEHFTVEGAA